MADKGPDGQFLPGHKLSPSKGYEINTPVKMLKRILKGRPLVGGVERAIEVLDIPDDIAAELRESENQMEVLMRLAAYRAMSGSWDAWREIMDRVAPKPRAVELSGPGGGPIESIAAVVQLGDDDAAARYQALLGAGADDLLEAEFDEEDPGG